MTAVVVLGLVTVGVFAVRNHRSGAGGPITTTSASTPPTAQTTATQTAATQTAATQTTATPTTAPTTSGFDPSDTDQLCRDSDASDDLIHLTVALSFATSYDTASSYEKPIIDSCATPAVIAALRPYFGKSLGLPGGDLTGGNGVGDTARYSVQLVNTAKYISFTLVHQSKGPGYRVVAITAG